MSDVGTVIVQTLGCFECYEVLMHALTILLPGGACVVVVNDIDAQTADNLQNHSARRAGEV